jgi:release factor glutamine methyltransferase
VAETALLLARKAADLFAERAIEQPRLDAELLLAHVLRITRLQLYLQHDRPVHDQELATFRALVRRRLRHEPVQYIVGSAHFRELELAVDARVLIPRPETEELVGHVLDWAWALVGGKPRRHGAEAPADAATRGHGDAATGELVAPGDAGAVVEQAIGDEAEAPSPRRRVAVSGEEAAEGVAASPPRRLVALDIGTGSGAIALSLLKEGPFERVVATDTSADALEVARGNAARLGLADRVEFRLGSLWQAVAPDEVFDVVASNPPYVAEPERAALAPEVAEWEPAGALFAGAAGLDVLRPLIGGVAGHVRAGGLLALELGATQGAAVLALIEATAAFEASRVERDLAGRDRVALARRISCAT